MTAGIHVRISGLDFSFEGRKDGSGPFQAFSASFFLARNELTVLRGKNGVGKSVLAQLLAGCLKPKAGSISFFRSDGNEQKEAVARVTYIPQNFEFLQDRFAIDLFQSFATNDHAFFNAVRFRRTIHQPPIREGELYLPCDRASRLTLLLGSLRAADFANSDLIIVDEPFAQLPDEDRKTLNAHFAERLERLAPPHFGYCSS